MCETGKGPNRTLNRRDIKYFVYAHVLKKKNNNNNNTTFDHFGRICHGMLAKFDKKCTFT